MPVDLQIRKTVLQKLIRGTVQQNLNATCIALPGAIIFDHADVKDVTVTVRTESAAVDLDTEVDIFTVDLPSLISNANSTPSGALNPAGSCSFHFSLSASGTMLKLSCAGVSSSNPGVKSIGGIICSQIPPANTDLASLFSALGLSIPVSAIIIDFKAFIMIRFDPSDGPVDHLQSTDEWGFFMNKGVVEDLVRSKLDIPLSHMGQQGITGISSTVAWAPSGSVPHVNVQIKGNVTVPDPFKAALTIDLGTDLFLTSVIPAKINQAPKILTEDFKWNLHIDGGAVPGPIGDVIDGMAASAFDPATFGGTVIGPREFTLSQSLPLVKLGAAVFFYGNLTGFPEGMSLSGKVFGIPASDNQPFSYSVTGYPARLTHYFDCLKAKPGFDGPIQLNDLSAKASAELYNAGKLCAVKQISPDISEIDLSPFLHASPDPGTVTDNVNISSTLLGFQCMIAGNIGKHVQLLLTTTRGVRVLDFGLPPIPKLDSNGNVIDIDFVVIDDCPGILTDWTKSMHAYNKKWGVDPYESWVTKMHQVDIFVSILVQIEGLEVGELVSFNQPLDGGMSVFSSGEKGHVTVPMVLPVRSYDANAVLSRISRRRLDNVKQLAVFFQRVVTLNTPGALSHRLAIEANCALITTSYKDHAEISRVDASGIVIRVQHKMPGKLKMTGQADIEKSENSHKKAGINGIERTMTVPGFESENIFIAEMDDKSCQVFMRDEEGAYRVGGLVPRWPDMPPVSGNWAISSSRGDRIAVFVVKRQAPAKDCSC